MKARKTEHPILFSTLMVQAILEGRKTMTRRIFKDHPRLASDVSKVDLKQWFKDYRELILSYCPYGQPGDKLWVRESFIEYAPNQFEYKAGFTDEPIKWRPSIHMPKAAARIWLEITDVRVERLQDISEEDAKAEGVIEIEKDEAYFDYKGDSGSFAHARGSFFSLWISINGNDSFESNPWVWVIKFKRIEPCQ